MTRVDMPLADLNPQLLKITEYAPDGGWRACRHDADFSDCDGLQFLCPKCFLANGGPIGTHGVICWKPSVPRACSPGPGRWAHEGTGLSDITLVAGSSSIQLTGGCAWHGYVRGGRVVDA